MKGMQSKQKCKMYTFLCLASFGLILSLLSIIPIRLAIAHWQCPFPQAILTLGGGEVREKFTAQFAKIDPSLEIWVSSGIPIEQARPIFRAAGIPDERVHFDRRAVDTVTNFTSLVKDLKNQKIHHTYLITSDFHMPRARAIATIVLGSQGITFTPISIPSARSPESKLEIARDASRAVIWLITGRTGSTLNPDYEQKIST